MKSPISNLKSRDAQARDARRLIQFLANRAAQEFRDYKAGRHADIAFGMYIGFRSAAQSVAFHLKQHGLLTSK